MKKLLRHFFKDQDASVTVEVVMVLPILLWGYFGMFILFDGYRALSANVQAAYTVSDLISREKGTINAAYINGMNDIQDVLTQSPHRTVLRVTAVTYNAGISDHVLDWSYSTAGQTAISAGNFDSEILPHLPNMTDGEQLIAVETWLAFVPFLNITLRTLWDHDAYSERALPTVFGPFYFQSIVVTRPRVPQLIWL